MDREIEAILEGILTHCAPKSVILYGEKRSLSSGCIKALDFCVILPEVDKPALLHELYLSIDAEVPFNVLLYTCEEWEELTRDFSSYASAICKKGTVLYEQKP